MGALPNVPKLLPLSLGMSSRATSGGSQRRRCFTVAFMGTGERGKRISRWRILIQTFPRLFVRIAMRLVDICKCRCDPSQLQVAKW